MTLNASPAERIARRIEVTPEGCWRWTGHTNAAGYAMMRLNTRTVSAHRTAYEAHVGPIPKGTQLDHICHTESDCPGGLTCPHRRCVNPAHLEPVTPTENVMRSNAPAAVNARKTHCNRGHELAGANLKIESNGHRRCVECRRVQQNARWPRRKLQRQASRKAAA